MMNKQDLVIELLRRKLATTKVGIIVKGLDGISPNEIIMALVSAERHLYAASIGYGDIVEVSDNLYTISKSIEKAVLWRSNPECAKNIIVFIKNDTDKLHSLAEFDVITTRDVARFLIKLQSSNTNNAPTNNFWNALCETSGYYNFDCLYEFVSTINESKDDPKIISHNMWMLKLLQDDEILGTKNKPIDSLAKNRDLIFAIGQLSEDSRKKLTRTLSVSSEEDKLRLQQAYAKLQNYYKYGNRETLKNLEFTTVQELFSASQNKTQKKKKKKNEDLTSGSSSNTSAPIKPKELDSIISDAIVSGDESAQNDIRELFDELKEHFSNTEDDKVESISTIGGIFEDREITPKQQTDLRKLVGKFCSSRNWGGVMETEESVLKDAISADINSIKSFSPEESDSIISFTGGIDGNQPLFDFIARFDEQFNCRGMENAERFIPIINNLRDKRDKLLASLDMIMYYPVLFFGASEDSRETLIGFIDAWEKLYHALCVNEPMMREISPGSVNFILRAILLLDILYVKTPKEWKAILLPLHPVYLWRYYEVFRMLPKKKASLNEEDKEALSNVLTQLPQIINFVVANRIVTSTTEDRILPCSGSIEMLPTFENKTNRYLGNDGTESLQEILTRWVGFAPYTTQEVRICTVDAPDLIGNIRQIKNFMDDNSVKRVIYDVYLTHNQNGNNELSKLDYSNRDYEIGEYIRNERISISVSNVRSLAEVKESLTNRPVHVAFYFDQSSYVIEYGPNNHNLYINPLVITYDYSFDDITHKGSIYPSSEMDSGLIGDYHKLMRSAEIVSNNMIPRTTYGNADMTAVVSTIRDKQAQWLVVADRDTNNYQPQDAIPIGEMQFDKRMVNVWSSDDSRIISQYLTLLRGYNLYPKSDTLINILRQFGHVASNGLISIPKSGADTQAVDNKKKGLIGTLFAATWYINNHADGLIASLDDDKARLWLQNSKYGNERADLVGLYYDASSNTLHVEPIEVKTRDESPDATLNRDSIDSKTVLISGHAADQVASMIEMLREIFSPDSNQIDMFTSARREVLKYQIVSECFRNVHDANWQKKWYLLLKKAFSYENPDNLNIVVSGLLLHIKLNESSSGEHITCKHPDFDDCRIDYWKLTAKEIQQEVLGESSLLKDELPIDFDNTGISINTSDDTDQMSENSKNRQSETSTDIEQSHEYNTNALVRSGTTDEFNVDTVAINTDSGANTSGVSAQEIEQLVKDFKRSCGDYHVSLKECNPEDSVIGPSVIRLKFRLGRGQPLQGLSNHLEDIGREMKRTGVIIQEVSNSDVLLLDVPRLKREQVLFKDVISRIPKINSPEQLYFPLGRTPNGKDLIEDLGKMPHMLVGGSTGSGKSVFLFTMLASLIMTHPRKKDMQLILSSSKMEDFVHFEGLPHLYSGGIISDAVEATHVIKDVVYEESERRGKLLAEARVANIIEYNKKSSEKLAPIVVVIDEFADLADQLESKKEKDAFYKPVQRIAQAGRSRGIHLVICTQRPEAKLVPSTTKAQLNARVALRVNDGISSRMIIESADAQYLQKHGDMIYKNGDITERAQGYLIEITELDEIVEKVIKGEL